MSEFVGANTYTCPCMYISSDVHIDDYSAAHRAANPLVLTTVQIDQEPFYRIGFDASPALSYRGGFAKHSVRPRRTASRTARAPPTGGP